MAIVHEATMRPDKVACVRDWLTKQPWAAGIEVTERIGSYRFDDPRGRVGVEFLLLGAGDQTVHLPLTYRAEPLAGAEDFLMAVAEHSVLGTRYVYDGCADPVAVKALLTAVLTGAEQEPMEYHRRSGAVEHRDATVLAKGSGSWLADEVPIFDGVSIERD
jgi:hypothetical protein